jgi:pyrroloquinoline-quinone synthase
MTNRDEALDQLDALIKRRSILRHPFYLAWQRGELTREQLATYAEIYYPHVAEFPQYLRNTISCTTDETTRNELAQNLADELGNPAPHPELWLDFAESVDADREKLRSSAFSTRSPSIVTTFTSLTSRDSASGLAALYAYESQQPVVASEKLRGLREFYGITDEEAIRYFSVHATSDIGHCADERAAIAREVEHGVEVNRIMGAASDALDAYWGLLDEVCEKAGVTCQLVEPVS